MTGREVIELVKTAIAQGLDCRVEIASRDGKATLIVYDLDGEEITTDLEELTTRDA